jgi:hypothetical protein
MVRSKVIRGPKDRHGKVRKFIQIPDTYYDDFQFGDLVEVQKHQKNEQTS